MTAPDTAALRMMAADEAAPEPWSVVPVARDTVRALCAAALLDRHAPTTGETP